MKVLMTAMTAVSLTALVATPAIGQDGDAATAACETYAQLKTETMPSASPRLDTSPRAAPVTPGVERPPAGGIQAPGAGADSIRGPERPIQAPGTTAGSASSADLAGKSAEFQQVFRDCLTKLGG